MRSLAPLVPVNNHRLGFGYLARLDEAVRHAAAVIAAELAMES